MLLGMQFVMGYQGLQGRPAFQAPAPSLVSAWAGLEGWVGGLVPELFAICEDQDEKKKKRLGEGGPAGPVFLVWSPPGFPEALLLEKRPGPFTASLDGEHGGRLLLTRAFSSLSPCLSSCGAARRPVVCHE